MEPIYLGFGSFQFQLTDSAPAGYKESEYLRWVSSGLEAIDGVSGVEVTRLRPEMDEELEKPATIAGYAETGEPVPFVEFTRIDFDLHISQEAQEELAKQNDLVAYDLGEDFRVRIGDGWKLPCAMVWGTACGGQRNASEALALVREALAAGFAKQDDSPIAFEWLERTPAFFTVHLERGAAGQEEEFRQLDRYRIGYDHYKFSYSREKFDDDKAATEGFFSRIIWELDLMYRTVRARKRRSRAWAEVTRDTQQILDAYEGTGLRNSLRRMSQGRRINRALIALARVELSQREELQELRGSFERRYRSGNITLIEAPVSDDLSEFTVIPVEPLSKLLEMFDARRNTARGVAIATIASLIGAIVAAVATLVAAG
ncbi:MAG TPA: hypothetical protein VMF55_15325 [Solirubrobacterales bacterium]|nr:hypothetical protein [Solirubrobacterales bacterium]